MVAGGRVKLPIEDKSPEGMSLSSVSRLVPAMKMVGRGGIEPPTPSSSD
jgi:hypothetical protein